LDAALEGARVAGAEVEKVVLSNLEITPCIACGCCEKTGNCILEDDMQELYERIGACDALIFASPIFFYSVSGWAKAAIDRAQAMWSRKYVMKDERYTADKPGYFIGVGATKGSKLFDGALLSMKYYFDAAGFTPSGNLLVRGVDEKGAIMEHPEHLEAARALGAGIVNKGNR
jgi:multimeric flavodoxin WrbA